MVQFNDTPKNEQQKGFDKNLYTALCTVIHKYLRNNN